VGLSHVPSRLSLTVHDGEKIAGKMIFVYGYVDILQGKRWGWIPLDALKLKSQKPL
jgi:hypothetical protein